MTRGRWAWTSSHPHAGVAPTTYLLSGSGRHTDSLQNDLIYSEGQFMVFSSGRGAIHEEVSSMEIRRDGGVVHGFQIWLNLPAAEKFSTPITTLRDKAEFPIIETEEYRIKVLMGEAFGRTAPTETHSPAFYHHIHIAEGGRLDLPVDPGHNAFVHVVDGRLEIEGRRELEAQQPALYHRGGDHLRFHSVGAECIVLGGQPLGEPVVSYGPFVMLTGPDPALHRRLPGGPHGHTLGFALSGCSQRMWMGAWLCLNSPLASPIGSHTAA